MLHVISSIPETKTDTELDNFCRKNYRAWRKQQDGKILCSDPDGAAPILYECITDALQEEQSAADPRKRRRLQKDDPRQLKEDLDRHIHILLCKIQKTRKTHNEEKEKF